MISMTVTVIVRMRVIMMMTVMRIISHDYVSGNDIGEIRIVLIIIIQEQASLMKIMATLQKKNERKGKELRKDNLMILELVKTRHYDIFLISLKSNPS